MERGLKREQADRIMSHLLSPAWFPARPYTITLTSVVVVEEGGELPADVADITRKSGTDSVGRKRSE
jgi:hypothetical protein